MKTALKMRDANVTPFVLDDRWALNGLDRSTMRSLSMEAKRKHVGLQISSTELSSHSSRNAKLRPISKGKLLSSDGVRVANISLTETTNLLPLSRRASTIQKFALRDPRLKPSPNSNRPC